MAARLRDELTSSGASTLWYDAGIVVTAPPTGKDWRNVPVLFGSSPAGPDELYTNDIRNRDRFQHRNGQLAFGVKQRAEATRDRFERGDKSVPEEACLFLPRDTPDEVLMELSQPTWAEGPTSRIQIKKAHDGERSPNRYDALVLSFAEDSADGLAALPSSAAPGVRLPGRLGSVA